MAKIIELKDRIAFVGLGQAGTNLTVLANDLGYVNGIINTSAEDLNNESTKSITNKLLIGTDGGAGKDRKLAQQNIKKYHSKIVDFFKNNIINSNVEYVFMCFSSGGGTGSGFGPIIIDVLRRFFPSVTFAALVATPSYNESPVALVNTRNCLEELYKLNIPLYLIDNNKYTKKSARNVMYKNINEEIIDNLDEFIKFTDPNGMSNMDTQDKITLLKTSGYNLVASKTFPKSFIMTEEALANFISEAITDSLLVTPNYNNVIKKVGFLFKFRNADDSKYINYEMIEKKIGKCLKTYEGIYDVSNRAEDIVPSILVFIGGLEIPNDKISDIDDLIEEAEDDSLMASENSNSSLLSTRKKTSLFDEEPVNDNTPVDFDFDLQGLFDQY